MKMNCDNRFCIYQEEGVCLLKKIELDITGQCKSCILVNISEMALKIGKEILRTHYEMKDASRPKKDTSK